MNDNVMVIGAFYQIRYFKEIYSVRKTRTVLRSTMAEGDLLNDCLDAQKEEVELLRSMYTSEELQCSMSSSLDEELSENELQLKIKISEAADDSHDEEVEITFQLPTAYPRLQKPDVFVRLSTLTGSQSRQLNEKLRNFINSEIELGDPVLTEIVVWIQEHATEALTPRHEAQNKEDSSKDKTIKFTRLWLYSHHLYSKFKRRDLLNLSSNLNLTGFTLPGKPGIVCVEGEERNCTEFWDEVRSWCWKKIVVKHREEIEISSNSDIDRNRKFPKVDEMMFHSKSSVGRNIHMDMGLFREYLAKYKADYMFQIYFGIQ